MPSGSRETQLLALVLHKTQRKHSLSDLGGIHMPPIHCTAPICLDAFICLDTTICLDASLYVWTTPCMFGFPLYAWTPLLYLDVPLYVQTTPVFTPPYVWMPPVHTQYKGSMLCQTVGVSICPHTFVHHPVCLNTPLCSDASKCTGASKGMWDIQTYRGIKTCRCIQTYQGHMDTH